MSYEGVGEECAHCGREASYYVKGATEGFTCGRHLAAAVQRHSDQTGTVTVTHQREDT